MGAETVPVDEESVKVDVSELEQKIIRQVEYYFGNYNLGRDKFLREQIKLDEGWVPLETMVKFNRLKTLSKEFAVIADALKKSPNQLLEINEDCTKIRRRLEKPLPEDTNNKRDEIDEKTLYVKGFKKTTTLDEVLEFFKEHKAENVFMRKRVQANNRVFKGSVFVTFETKEDAEKFLEIKGIKYCGTELLKEKKKDYVKKKDIYYQNLRAEKEKKLLQKTTEQETEKETDVTVSEIDIIPGCLLKLSGLGKDSTREDIKKALGKYGYIVYVDYFKGNPGGVVRFETGVAAEVLQDIPEKDGERKLDIGSCKATICGIEGDDEKEYWKSIAVSRANSRLRYPKNNRGGGKGRFRKNWNKRQNRRDDRDGDKELPAEKHIKLESPQKVENMESKEESPEKHLGKSLKVEPGEENIEKSPKQPKVELNDEKPHKPSQKRAKEDDETIVEHAQKKVKVESHENGAHKVDEK